MLDSETFDFLAKVLEHVDEGLIVVDERRRISFVNRAGAALLAYGSPDELVGLPVHETVHYKRPDGSRFPAAECPHLAVFVTGRSSHGEDWFVRKDGSMLPVAYSSAPIPLVGGRGTVMAFRDTSQRRRLEREREREHEFLDAVLESLDTGIVGCDPEGVLTLFNRATREMHATVEEPLGPEDWAGRYDLFRSDGKTPLRTDDVPLFRALRGERVRELEMVIAPENRPQRRVLCNGQAIASKDGRALGAVVAMHDVTERRRAEEELAHQALHDSLTGLPNRALLLDRLGHALALAPRTGSAVAVLFADLDHFKLVNAGLGHQAGDELLVAVARRLDESLRASDTVGRPGSSGTVARLGGDVFVVLCELANERAAIRIAERITDGLSAPFRIGDEEMSASASIGIALSDESATPESMLRDADAAMYRAKERGRARYELFDETMHARLSERLQAEDALRRAIEQDELRLHYQPIVALADGRVVAAEALVRWQHPERGLLAPGAFIDLAEDSGLIVPLGAWVLREGCRQIAAWERAFATGVAPLVSVNISARQLSEPQIVEEVERAMAESGVDPSHLALEITETVLLEDGATTLAKLERLRRLGCRLMLDDFGTGYSSLSYLGRLPFDALKLDGSFVAPLGPGGEGRAIAAAIVDLAHALHMTIVAEGVETREQLGVLETLGCDLAQGFLFDRPLPAAAMTSLLTALPTGQISAPRIRQDVVATATAVAKEAPCASCTPTSASETSTPRLASTRRWGSSGGGGCSSRAPTTSTWGCPATGTRSS